MSHVMNSDTTAHASIQQHNSDNKFGSGGRSNNSRLASRNSFNAYHSQSGITNNSFGANSSSQLLIALLSLIIQLISLLVSEQGSQSTDSSSNGNDDTDDDGIHDTVVSGNDPDSDGDVVDNNDVDGNDSPENGGGGTMDDDIPNSSSARRIVMLVPDPNSQGFLPTHPHDLTNIRNQWNLPPLQTNQKLTIFDTDGDGELSEGDRIVITESGVIGQNAFGYEVLNHTITQADLLVIESDPIQSRLDFDENRQKWIGNRPSSYGYTLDQNPGGIVSNIRGAGQPVDITFEYFPVGGGPGGRIDSAEFTSGVSGPIPTVNRRSIDDLFDIIDAALNQTSTIPVVIQYNPQLGYPESIHIDYQPPASDDELDYEISDFFRGQVRM